MDYSLGVIETAGKCRKLSSNALQAAAGQGRESRDWLLLPDDVTKNIILRLEPFVIFGDVQYVCKSWYRLCKRPETWTFIDFIFKVWLWRKYYPSIRDGMVLRELHDAMRLRAIERSCGQVVAITVDTATWQGDHIWQIVKRSCSSLKRLTVVSYMARFSMVQIALSYLPSLQVFELIWCHAVDDVIEGLGTYAPSLHTLRWYPSIQARSRLCRFTDGPNYEAFAIAKHLPKLRHLSLYANPLDNQGLLAILDGCHQLESLDLRKCRRLNLTKGSVLLQRCKQISQLWLPRDLNPPGAFKYKLFEDIIKRTDFLAGLVLSPSDGRVLPLVVTTNPGWPGNVTLADLFG